MKFARICIKRDFSRGNLLNLTRNFILFIRRLLSDIIVGAFNQSYHLHRILLIRSPYLERLIFNSDFEKHANLQMNLSISDENITPESLSICLAHLYGTSVVNHVRSSNVRHVLACAFMLELVDLCIFCSDFMIQTISSDNLDSILEFVTSDSSKHYGSYTDGIQAQCITYLSVSLPARLEAFTDTLGEEQLAAVYATLPFSWLKMILEDELQVDSNFFKYQFAQKVIEKRKVRTESVLMVFDRDMKGKVTLNKK